MKTNTEYFLSCDWGTSSFRIRLAGCEDAKVLFEERSGQGIAATFNLWQERHHQSGIERAGFYLDIIAPHIKSIEAKMRRPLNGVKLFISGMASSSIGFIEIPYNCVPLAIDGSGLKTAAIPAGRGFDHDVVVISGVRTGEDVMRGEETELIGCTDAGQDVKNELFIFPGTHSKHVSVINNQITGLKTYMTGEFFALLSEKSVLKNSVEPAFGAEAGNYLAAFKDGVKAAVSGDLLHSAFMVRTNHLFDRLTPRENFYYLSGLLIGTELKDLSGSAAGSINLLGNGQLARYYKVALEELDIAKTLNMFPPAWVDEAAVRGHHKIGRQLKILA